MRSKQRNRLDRLQYYLTGSSVQYCSSGKTFVALSGPSTSDSFCALITDNNDFQVYPSEFGKEKMAEENAKGPVELMKTKEDDLGGDSEGMKVCWSKLHVISGHGLSVCS